MPSTGCTEQSTVQLPAMLKRDNDPYYGFSFYDRPINVSEVSGIPNSVTCFVSFKKNLWLEACGFDSLI